MLFGLVSWFTLAWSAPGIPQHGTSGLEAVCVGEARGALHPATRAAVFRAAEVARSRTVEVPTHLSSAGRSVMDEDVLSTRRAFSDADDVRLLALAWGLSGRDRYLDSVSERLGAWADRYRPSGHPIDETRLEALVVAYRIVEADLSTDERQRIRAFFLAMREAKEAWAFASRTSVSNHRPIS